MNCYPKFFLLLCLSLFVLIAQGQNGNDKNFKTKFDEARQLINKAAYKEGIIKLESLFKETSSDTSKVNIQVLMATAYRRMGDFEMLNRTLKEIDLKKATLKQQAAYFNFKGYYYRTANKLDSAIFYTKKALEVFESLKINLGTPYNNLAYLYRDKGDSFNQLVCIKKAYEELLKTKDSTEIIYSIYALGDYYVTTKQGEKAKKYILECINYQKKSDLITVKSFDGFNQAYSQILYDSKDYKESLKFAQAALAIDQKYEDLVGQIYSYKMIATNYLSLQDLPLAHTYAQKGLDIAKKTEFPAGLAFMYTLIGEIELKLKNYNKATDYLKNGILYAKEVDDYELLATCNKLLIEIFKSQNRLDLALYHTEQYGIANDSLFTSQNRKNAITLLAQFESEQKDNKILVQQLSLSEKTAQNRELLSWMLSIAVIALILAMLVFYVRYRNKLKVAELLLKMQNDLESFHREVKSSFRKSSTEISLMGGSAISAILNKTDDIIKKEQHLSSVEQDFFNGFKFKLNDINEDLQSRINKVKTFSYSISHDLKEPLAQALQLTKTSAYQTSLPELAEIEEYLQQSNELVRAYTALGEIESAEVNLQELDLKDLVMSELRKVKKLDSFTPDCQINVGNLGLVYADALLVRQVIWNLITNSLKYRKINTPCVVNISTHKITDTETTILFSDNGIGFPPEFSQRIFVPFARHISAKQQQGFGMGLALCKQIVEKIGGKIVANSDGSNGAEFFVTLPAVPK